MANEDLRDLGEYIQERLGDIIISSEVLHGQLSILAKRDEIVKVLQFLRDDRECAFKILIDLCGADYPDRGLEERFEIVYQLLSISQNNRVRIKVRTSEEQPVPSVTGVYSAAGWFEREAWDMYGVYFKGNADLRRILTDYGFEGHPLRKDFPLTGYVEVRYDEELRRVVYEPVQLTQDFRYFDYTSPWEGMTNVQLPGDEKAMTQSVGWVDTRTKAKSKKAS